MIVSETIRDIESYLAINPPTEPQKSSITFPKLDGGLSAFSAVGVVSLVGDVFIGTAVNNSSGMLEGVLARCSDEQLDELMMEYGEDSELGKIICRRRAVQYISKGCSAERIAKDIEAIIKPKMGENSF